MIHSLKTALSRNITNARGWRTNRKIVVIESDDWGMVRMSSKKAQENYISKGYQISQCPYNSNDRVENDQDIKLLSEVLMSVKDKHGNPAKLTLNNIVANPDFEKIKKANFTNYYYQTFVETLNEYNDAKCVIPLIKQGIKNNIFQPQLHGREHLNIRLWFERLNCNDARTMDAFEHKMYTVHKYGSINGRIDNLDTYGNVSLDGDLYDYQNNLKEAQEIFQDVWGFKSESFIAPCYVWHPDLEKVLAKEGIKYIQGSRVQKIPIDDTSFKIDKKYHYTGQKNKYGQIYLVRNCFFEPSEYGRTNIIKNTLKEIKLSFLYKKPAIISSHRVNYMGSLNPRNRRENLNLLQNLLNSIVKYWPDVEFMSSDQLGNLIVNKK